MTEITPIPEDRLKIQAIRLLTWNGFLHLRETVVSVRGSISHLEIRSQNQSRR